MASDVVKAYMAKRHGTITVLPSWPPHSPDLNPIENLWSWVEAKVEAQGCKTFEEFKQAVLDQLEAVPKAMFTRLVDSMHKRMASVIKLGGDKTKY